jgi:hypothetical protein
VLSDLGPLRIGGGLLFGDFLSNQFWLFQDPHDGRPDLRFDHISTEYARAA